MSKRKETFQIKCPTCLAMRTLKYAGYMYSKRYSENGECKKCAANRRGCPNLVSWIVTNLKGKPGKKKENAISRQRFDVQCPECKSVRSIGYKALWNQKNGIASPICFSCNGKKENSGQFKEGLVVWNKGMDLGPQPLSVRLKKSITMKRIAKELGWTKNTQDGRKSLDYRLWRESVFKRDDFTCQDCGERGGKLNAHHIKPWSVHTELRFCLDNGRTLCESCHKETPTWGFKMQNYQLTT